MLGRPDPQRLGRRRHRQPAVPRRRRDRGRRDRRGRAARRRCDRDACRRRIGQGRLPGLRRPAQPQRLLAAREPDRREHDPPGRDDRGRRQLRLELRAGLRPLARVHERPAPHLRLRRPRDPVDDVRRAPRLPRGCRAHPQSGVVRRPQLDQARGRRLRLAPDRAAGRADGPPHAGGDGGRRARNVDRARVQPGPRGDDGGARAPERDRRRVRRHLHEPRPQPRLGHPARDRRVPRGRPRRRDPRRDLPPQRPAQHGRARPRLGARGRDDGGRARGRAWTCSPTRRRSSTASASSPGSCRPGSPPTARRQRSPTCAIPETRKRLRTECDRYWRFIHKGEWDRVRLQASEQHPEWDGLTFAEIADLRKADPWDCYFDVLADAGDAYESILVVGRLFTDEHMAEMISHPLFCLGVDTFTVTRGRPARGRPPPSARLLRPRPLPHPPRAGERHAAARGGDPQDDEHAGRALRPLGPRPPPQRLRRRCRRLRLRRARRGLDGRRPAPLRARRRARARQRHGRRRRWRAHAVRDPGGTCCGR